MSRAHGVPVGNGHVTLREPTASRPYYRLDYRDETGHRVTQVAIPAANGAPARTVTTNYAVNGNPLVSSVSDPAGTITTTIDLLGRTVAYTDVKGTTTTTTYDAAGRPAQQVSTPAAGGPTSTVTTTYLDDGRVNTVAVDGTVVSQPSYDANAEMTGVTYPTLTDGGGSTLATPAFVQQTSTHQTNVSSATVTPSVVLTAGSRLIVQVGVWASTKPTVASVSDSAGDVFTKVSDTTASDSTQMSIWTAPVTAGAGKTPVITVTPSVTADVGVVAAEYSGLATTGTGVDVQTHATDTTTAAGTVSSGTTPATVGGNELAIGFYADSGFGDTLTAGTGYTQRANIAPTNDLEMLVQDQVVPAGTAVSSTFGTGPSTTWQAAVVVFKPTTTSTAAPPPATGGTVSTITRNPAGQQTAVSYALPGHTLTDTVARSQSGRVMTDTAALDSTAASAWSYTYDTAGRLTQAVLGVHGSTPAVTYGYGYAATGGCGADPRAGVDGARSTATVQVGNGTPTVTTSCTDYASRLTSVTNGGTATYNSHGDGTSIAEQSFTYDAADRVTAGTGVGGNQTITYTLDATGRIVTRVGTGAGAGVDTTTSVYSHAGDGDSPDLQLTAAGTIGERYLSLPGGVLYAKPYANPGGDVWALTNIHGDTLATTAGDGTIIGTVATYDPFGNPLNLVTGLTDQATDPITRTTSATDAWLGSHQRSSEHAAGSAWTIMGARVYLPGLGQFASVDSVVGGNVTAYAYPLDPINQYDLNGQFSVR